MRTVGIGDRVSLYSIPPPAPRSVQPSHYGKVGSTSCPAEGPLPPRLRLWHQWAESDALSSEAANGKSASSEVASDKSASSEAASDKSASSEAVSDKSASSENGSDHSTPQPSGDDPSSDELDDRVGDDFPYKELPSKRWRTSHASEPHSHSRSRTRSQGHRHRHQKGDSCRKEGRRSYFAHSSNYSSGDSRHNHSSSSASRMIALFAIADTGTVVTTTHHPVPVVFPAPVVIQAVGHHQYRHHCHRSHKLDRAMVSCAQHHSIPSHAILDGKLGEVICQF